MTHCNFLNGYSEERWLGWDGDGEGSWAGAAQAAPESLKAALCMCLSGHQESLEMVLRAMKMRHR